MTAEPPGDEDAAQRIRSVLEVWDAQAEGHRRRSERFGLLTSVLTPLAVLLLSIQAIVFPRGGVWAVLLVAGEVVALGVAVASGYLGMGRSYRSWIGARLRAEILRREFFLLRAGAGPYLGLDAGELPGRARRRLLAIEAASDDPLPLIAFESEGQHWSDTLEESREPGSLPDLETRLAEYVAGRVERQRCWFAERSERWRWWDRLLENGARATLAVALAVAGVHLGSLLGTESHRGTLTVVLVVVALALPPVGAALVAIRALFESHRLHRSYGHHVHELARVQDAFVELQELARDGAPSRHLVHHFRRLVLRTEQLLTNELLQWWLIMGPEPPQAL